TTRRKLEGHAEGVNRRSRGCSIVASGLALEVRDLAGLLLRLLLRARELVLRLALALLHAALTPQRRIVCDVARGLLGPTGDLVQNAHSDLLFWVARGLPEARCGQTAEVPPRFRDPPHHRARSPQPPHTDGTCVGRECRGTHA